MITNNEIDWLETAKSRVVPSIGQLDARAKRRLDVAVKRGEIDKWRGAWFPVPGGAFGMAPFKTCYGPAGIRFSLGHKE